MDDSWESTGAATNQQKTIAIKRARIAKPPCRRFPGSSKPRMSIGSKHSRGFRWSLGFYSRLPAVFGRAGSGCVCRGKDIQSPRALESRARLIFVTPLSNLALAAATHRKNKVSKQSFG